MEEKKPEHTQDAVLPPAAGDVVNFRINIDLDWKDCLKALLGYRLYVLCHVYFREKSVTPLRVDTEFLSGRPKHENKSFSQLERKASDGNT